MSLECPLASAFAAASAAPVTALEALEEALSKALEEGQRAWPGLDLEPTLFVQHLAKRVRSGTDPLAALGKLQVPDLYLACACTHGLRAALEVFTSRFLLRTAAFVSRLRLSADGIDEVRQALSEKLLVPEADQAPRIAEYAGTGSLEGWVRIAALRTALNRQRGEGRREKAGSRALALSAPTPDPELELLKHRHRADFEEAFRLALASLPPRDRGLIRMHYLDGLSVPEISRLHGVHRATGARWLASAQAAVLEETRRLLRQRLGLSPTECDSLLGLVQSRLEVTLHSLLHRTEC
jgi:RNA polymerase sigma-70 factor (ECF subfamily)